MPHKITSTITILSSGCMGGCDMPKKFKHHRKKEHDHEYQSKAVSHKNRLFHHVSGKQNGVQQNVNVSVNVQKDDDPVTGCFRAMLNCFK